MAEALYLLTWTTYGTWLHGDTRGSVDDAHNIVGHPVVAPDRSRHVWNDAKLVEPAFKLCSESRAVVRKSIHATTQFRRWSVMALYVGVNHVHVVVEAPGATPEVVAKSLKSWATRALRDARLLEGRTRVWTKRASTRYLNSDASRAAAVDYVSRFQ